MNCEAMLMTLHNSAFKPITICVRCKQQACGSASVRRQVSNMFDGKMSQRYSSQYVSSQLWHLVLCAFPEHKMGVWSLWWVTLSWEGCCVTGLCVRHLSHAADGHDNEKISITYIPQYMFSLCWTVDKVLTTLSYDEYRHTRSHTCNLCTKLEL